MEAKHTPGPWEMVSLSGYGSPFSIRMAYLSDNPDAHKTHYGVQSVRRREDAILIAAAPDLLAAIHDLVVLNDDHSPFGGEVMRDRVDRAWDKARSAIAKAEGRS